MIVVITAVPQLPLEISGTPEGNVIQQLSTYGSDHYQSVIEDILERGIGVAKYFSYIS